MLQKKNWLTDIYCIAVIRFHYMIVMKNLRQKDLSPLQTNNKFSWTRDVQKIAYKIGHLVKQSFMKAQIYRNFAGQGLSLRMNYT